MVQVACFEQMNPALRVLVAGTRHFYTHTMTFGVENEDIVVSVKNCGSFSDTLRKKICVNRAQIKKSIG